MRPSRFIESAAPAAWLRVSALIFVTTMIWMWHCQRWTPASWRYPTEYVSDAHEVLARLQAASEGDTRPLTPQRIDRLGAPFGARWNAYPAPDKPLMLALGGVARMGGLFPAANFGLWLAQVSAALAFYLVARRLRCRWEWAWVSALLFAYTYQSFHRGLGHFSFVFSWTVPLGLLAVWLVAGSRRLEWRSRGALVCLGAGLALGLHNPYNLFFWLQLMGWAVIAQWYGARRRPNLGLGLAAIGVALVAFGAMHLETWLYVEDTGALPLLARNYGGTERYALKPLEMFIPPPDHRWDWFAFFGQRYGRWSEWRGEAYLPYLGIIGIVGFGWLAAATLRRLFTRRVVPGQALSIGWLLAFAGIGGVTNLLAFFAGLQVFRATNRVTIFISALVLFFLATRLSRVTAGWSRWLRWSAAGTVALLGIFDQVSRPPPAAKTAEIAAAVDADRELGRALEAALPAGAMVFQLPVLGFPEIVPPQQLVDYEHFRPYLATETLRFSYGAAKFRARSRWQRDLENAPPATLVRRLEAYGFSALYLNRKGYADRATRLLAELAKLGYTRRIESRLGHQVVVLLHPQVAPKLPLGRVFTYGRGWQPSLDGGVRWAYEDAALSYFNPYEQPVTVDLEFTLSGVSPRELRIEHEGCALRTQAVDRTPVTVKIAGLALPPGVNRFDLRCAEPAVRAGPGLNRLRTFGLHAASIKVTSEPTLPD